MQQILQNNLVEVSLLLKKHKVKKAYVFGSVLSDKFNKDSDIDFVIDIDEKIAPADLGEHLWDLQLELQELFGRDIDLVTSRSLKNPYFKSEVERTKKLIYE